MIVKASDDAPGVGDSVVSSEKKVIINVTNASELGSVSVDRSYPQVNVLITPTLTDGDATTAEIGAASWKWYTGTNTEVGTDGTDGTYAPGDGKTLKVVATYDAKGNTRTATKAGITVRAVPSSNGAPTFPEPTTARSVDENKRAGTNVGKAIEATDPDTADRNKLTYTLSESDNTSFSINTSGQLKTKVPLDHEAPPNLILRVTVTDPSGVTGEVEVTVTITDVNEAPTIDTGPTRADSQPENIPITTPVAVYAASDPETTEIADLVWSLTGTDASDFDIGNEEGGTPGTLTFKEVPNFEKPAATRNLYRVTVTVSDGKLKATRPMTVTVTDVDEGGVITLSSVQPKVAVDLIASLEDSDGGVKDITWQWYDGATDDDPTRPIDGATSATYTPVAGDVGKTLWVRAAYTDRRGETSATATTAPPVVVITNTDNRAPVFRAGGVAAGKVIISDTRSVSENSGADTDIGVPVVATDPNLLDNLTYMLGGRDAALFKILTVDDDDTDDTDKRGQIQVKAGTKLNYETKNTYMVTVTATDPNGLSDSIDVTITVTDLNEAPEIIVGGLAITGLSAVSYAENGMGSVAPYMAAGPDAASATWSLSGADMGDFMISSTGVLTFRSSPDFETPADANTDNTYMVTVEANDGTNTVMKAVTINVTNVGEDGTVSLSATQPAVGEALTATLTDPDSPSGVTGVVWQWASENTDGSTYTDIAGAESDSYTPAAADDGKHLRVTATYTDGYDAGNELTARSENPVTAGDPLLVRYDADKDGWIQLKEVRAAVGDYFGPPKGVTLSLDDTRKVVGLYFEYLNRQ